MRTFLGFVVLTASLAVSDRVMAQTSDAAGAEALFDQGQAAKSHGDFRTACTKFAESERLDRAAGTLLNLADCEERLAELADAWQHWREAIDALPAGDDRVAIAKQRLATLEPRVPRLTIRLAAGTPEGSTAKRDGVALGAASLGVTLPVNPGAHVIVLRAEGFADRSITVTLAEGEHKETEIGPGPRETGQAAGSPNGSGALRRNVGFALGGLGVIGFGAAIVTGLMLPAKRDDVAAHCVAKLCDAEGLSAASAGKTLLGVNTAAWVIGYVGVGAGAALVLTSGLGGESTSVRATATPGGASFSIVRSIQ